MIKQYLSAFKNAPIALSSLLIALALPLATFPEITHAVCDLGTHCDDWGTREKVGNTWNNGVDVYSNGHETGVWDVVNQNYDGLHATSNTVSGVTSGTEWQCVELVNRFYLTNGWTTATWTGDGNTLKDHLPTGFSFQDATHVTSVNEGDTVTFDGQTSGHAAIVDTVSGSSITLVSQNTQSTTLAASWNSTTHTLTSSALGSLYTVQGLIHHPGTNPVQKTTTIGFTRVNGSDLEWRMRDDNSPGNSTYSFVFGTSTDTPVVGDWDGDGTTTIGFVRVVGSSLEWHLRNSNTAGSSDVPIFTYGTSTDTPVVGDWDGNGSTTVGFTNVSGSQIAWHMRNANTSGSSTIAFNYGAAGGAPVVGDWDGNGTVTVGYVDTSGSALAWHMRNSNSAGSSTIAFNYGTSTDHPVVGDWDGDHDTTPGFTNVFGSNLQWHLRNTNSAGNSDNAFNYGLDSDNGHGITGNWDGL